MEGNNKLCSSTYKDKAYFLDHTYKIGTERLKARAPYIFEPEFLKKTNPDKWVILYWAKAISPSVVRKNSEENEEVQTPLRTKKKVRGMVITNCGKPEKMTSVKRRRMGLAKTKAVPCSVATSLKCSTSSCTSRNIVTTQKRQYKQPALKNNPIKNQRKNILIMW